MQNTSYPLITIASNESAMGKEVIFPNEKKEWSNIFLNALCRMIADKNIHIEAMVARQGITTGGSCIKTNEQAIDALQKIDQGTTEYTADFARAAGMLHLFGFSDEYIESMHKTDRLELDAFISVLINDHLIDAIMNYLVLQGKNPGHDDLIRQDKDHFLFATLPRETMPLLDFYLTRKHLAEQLASSGSEKDTQAITSMQQKLDKIFSKHLAKDKVSPSDFKEFTKDYNHISNEAHQLANFKALPGWQRTSFYQSLNESAQEAQKSCFDFLKSVGRIIKNAFHAARDLILGTHKEEKHERDDTPKI